MKIIIIISLEVQNLLAITLCCSIVRFIGLFWHIRLVIIAAIPSMLKKLMILKISLLIILLMQVTFVSFLLCATSSFPISFAVAIRIAARSILLRIAYPLVTVKTLLALHKLIDS